jgi:multimeric flavodoxin WrbA
MTEKPLVILASARKQSYTKNFLNKVFADKDYELIDLLDFYISPYSYLNNYPSTDEFLKIIDELIKHKVIVFATPVYWYAMSGIMKTFFDRFTDVVTTKKHLGRQLQGKSTFLVAVGAEEELPNGFEIPFKLTSDYLHMKYQDCIYYSTKFPKTEEKLQAITQDFKEKVKSTNR